MDNLSGPVGVVKQGADLAQRDGALAMLQFAAVISINLAVINSLPIPGLDGGQVRSNHDM
jgi:membrane-associated protease RseP (regulator of RpoE activity)